MELTQLLKDCLKEASNRLPEADWEEVVREGFETYYIVTGGPVEVESDEEGEELVEAAAYYVAVELPLSALMDAGLVEMSGMDETGDFAFSLTEAGKQVAKERFGI